MEQNRFVGQNLLFVTGRLAESALRRMASELQQQFDVRITIQVLPITVAALMTPAWIARHINVPDDCDVIVLPGYCKTDLRQYDREDDRVDDREDDRVDDREDDRVDDGWKSLREVTNKPVEFGPRELRRLPEFFGGELQSPTLDKYSIEIIAEINYAPRITINELIRQAVTLRDQGADVIDVGCEPSSTWAGVGVAVKELVDRGLRVSIDSLNPLEIQPAVEAGASLVLSVNSGNRDAAVDWGCEVVAIPDQPDEWMQVAETVDFLAERNVSLRIDPILEPIGFGFARSLSRYMEARKIWPDAEMMMGIGNLTELSDVDSSGVNFLLLAICEELAIGSILTTQVINWARSSVRECDIARRLVHMAISQKIPPKNLDTRLVCLRDARLVNQDPEYIQELADQIRDNNYRVISDQEEIHLLGGGQHWKHADAFELFQQLLDTNPANLDPSHAFYLGYEMCKATIANQLGKNYEQDEALDWGHLSVEEVSHRRLKRSKRTSVD